MPFHAVSCHFMMNICDPELFASNRSQKATFLINEIYQPMLLFVQYSTVQYSTVHQY
jgi:hypothetical protein